MWCYAPNQDVKFNYVKKFCYTAKIAWFSLAKKLTPNEVATSHFPASCTNMTLIDRKTFVDCNVGNIEWY